jgi:hypothetical protein
MVPFSVRAVLEVRVSVSVVAELVSVSVSFAATVSVVETTTLLEGIVIVSAEVGSIVRLTKEKPPANCFPPVPFMTKTLFVLAVNVPPVNVTFPETVQIPPPVTSASFAVPDPM